MRYAFYYIKLLVAINFYQNIGYAFIYRKIVSFFQLQDTGVLKKGAYYIMVKRSRIVAFFLIALLIFSAMGTTSKGILNDIKLGLDLQGGFEVLYEVKPLQGEKVTEEMSDKYSNALERRVNVLGVSEPNIQIEGKDRIRVQLAGVTDQNKAREIYRLKRSYPSMMTMIRK